MQDVVEEIKVEFSVWLDILQRREDDKVGQLWKDPGHEGHYSGRVGFGPALESTVDEQSGHGQQDQQNGIGQVVLNQAEELLFDEQPSAV